MVFLAEDYSDRPHQMLMAQESTQMRQVDRLYGDLILGVLPLVRFSRMRTGLELAWMLQVVPCDQHVRLDG